MGLKTRTPSSHKVPERVIERFWEAVTVGSVKDCWLWTKSLGTHGYGQVGWAVGGRNAGTTSHRVAWIAANGPIPEGMTVDHVCRNRPCCNPAHLRLLTNVDNATDNGQGAKTHCPQGHPYAGENLYVTPKGHRRCRACAAGRRRR